MRSDFRSWLTGPSARQRRRRRPRTRLGGCLLIVLLLAMLVLVLSLLFGGFRTGTKSSGSGQLAPACPAGTVSCRCSGCPPAAAQAGPAARV